MRHTGGTRGAKRKRNATDDDDDAGSGDDETHLPVEIMRVEGRKMCEESLLKCQPLYALCEKIPKNAACAMTLEFAIPVAITGCSRCVGAADRYASALGVPLTG
jgi:hypothetical protein